MHLEIIPHIQSNSLKKWIKLNQIGRNEFIYTLKVDYPRNIGIYGHNQEAFEELGFTSFSIRNSLRNQLQIKDELTKEMFEIMNKEELIPNELIDRLILKNLTEIKGRQTII